MADEKLLSDHLLDALAAISAARKALRYTSPVNWRDTIQGELTAAEMSISRVIGLIAGEAYGRPD